MAHRRIGQVLVDMGFITDEQQELLLDEQREHPGQLAPCRGRIGRSKARHRRQPASPGLEDVPAHTAQGWKYAAYAWSEDESEALLVTARGLRRGAVIRGDGRHDIPARCPSRPRNPATPAANMVRPVRHIYRSIFPRPRTW